VLSARPQLVSKPSPGEGTVRCISVAKDAKSIAFARDHGKVYVSTLDGTVIWENARQESGETISDLDLRADGKVLAYSISGIRSVVVVDPPNRRIRTAPPWPFLNCRLRLQPHADPWMLLITGELPVIDRAVKPGDPRSTISLVGESELIKLELEGKSNTRSNFPNEKWECGPIHDRINIRSTAFSADGTICAYVGLLPGYRDEVQRRAKVLTRENVVRTEPIMCSSRQKTPTGFQVSAWTMKQNRELLSIIGDDYCDYIWLAGNELLFYIEREWTAQNSAHLVCWNVVRRVPKWRYRFPLNGKMIDADLSSQGARLAWVDEKGTISAMELTDQPRISSFYMTDPKVVRIRWLNGDSDLACGDAKGAVSVLQINRRN
jgi:hypothetical protein